jgi:hypothetical protein
VFIWRLGLDKKITFNLNSSRYQLFSQMGMRNFIHSKAVDEEITYPVISVSGESGSSPPTKCCSQEESTPLLPIASSICAKVDYGKERKTER